jgi:hypothetical protein
MDNVQKHNSFNSISFNIQVFQLSKFTFPYIRPDNQEYALVHEWS